MNNKDLNNKQDNNLHSNLENYDFDNDFDVQRGNNSLFSQMISIVVVAIVSLVCTGLFGTVLIVMIYYIYLVLKNRDYRRKQLREQSKKSGNKLYGLVIAFIAVAICRLVNPFLAIIFIFIFEPSSSYRKFVFDGLKDFFLEIFVFFLIFAICCLFSS